MKLWIPRKDTGKPAQGTKDAVSQKDYGIDMRVIERAILGGGLYASLTGPGETVTPGTLTQEGDFNVDGQFDATTSNASTIQLTNFSAIMVSEGRGGTIIQADKGDATLISPGGNTNLGASGYVDLLRGSKISFDGGVSAAFCPLNITGSRGGNAALADLLTQLASIGLITDSTTP